MKWNLLVNRISSGKIGFWSGHLPRKLFARNKAMPRARSRFSNGECKALMETMLKVCSLLSDQRK